jgi:hypothetical protein
VDCCRVRFPLVCSFLTSRTDPSLTAARRPVLSTSTTRRLAVPTLRAQSGRAGKRSRTSSPPSRRCASTTTLNSLRWRARRTRINSSSCVFSFPPPSHLLVLTRFSLLQVHLPTCSVFQNWPTQQTPLHHVTAIDFSKSSEYMAVGNQRGKVLLYEVKQFSRGTRGRVKR